MKKLKAAGAAVAVTAQFAGAASAMAGVALLLGVAAALIIGGVALTAWGTAREAGWL